MHKSIVLLFSISLIWANKPYFQQRVDYEIDVKLNDSLHTLSAYEKIVYSNQSPDTLDYLWFHLWPNAYKNVETAFAKQKFQQGSTRFHFSKSKDRGYIDSLDFRENGKKMKWEYHPEWIDVAKLQLSEPLVPGGSLTIETPFHVKLPLVFSRLGHNDKHYEITQWYPKPTVYDRDGWHHMPYLDMGEFYSEFGTFDVRITLPANYRVMATGDLVNGEAEYAWLDSLAAEGDSLHALEKKAFKKKLKAMKKARKKKIRKKKEPNQDSLVLKKLHFHQENVHDFAWFADQDWIVRKGKLFLADSTHEIILWSMYLPKNAKLWEKSIEYLHDSGYWYSQFFGEYPYNHITAVDGDLSAGGGMEYPNITVISSGGSKDLLEFVIMHEVGHNWVYGILGSNERDHAWMDEGLNDWSNIRYWDKKYQSEEDRRLEISKFIQGKLKIASHLRLEWIMGYMLYTNRVLSGDDQPIELPSTEFDQSNYGVIVYGKTGYFTRFLQHYLGEDLINKATRDYYESWKFKHPGPEDFEAAFDKHVDEDLSWFFDEAIRSTKYIDYGIRLKKDGFEIINHGSLNSPVEIVFYDNDRVELKRQWVSGFTGSTMIEEPAGTVSAVIDPDNFMPDVDRTNNAIRRPLEFHFVFDQPTYWKREIYYVPWLFSGNAFNGLTPGLMLYSGYIPPFDFGIFALPMWDFKNKTLVGSLGGQKSFYQNPGFRKLTFSGNYSKYSGRRGFEFGFSGRIKKPIVSTPVTDVIGQLFTHIIDSNAVHPDYYNSGKFTTAKLSIKYSHRPNSLLRYSGKIGMITVLSGGEFAKFYATGNLRWRFTKKVNTSMRMWAGSFLNNTDVPNQYRTYLGGGIDPDFESKFVFNRTDDGGKGIANLYDEQYIQDGPGLRGLVLGKTSEQTTWGVNLDQTLPFVPITIFLDGAGASDLNDTFIDAGITIRLQVLWIHIPLYQSWDDQKIPDNSTWIKDRIRFELNFSGFAIRI